MGERARGRKRSGRAADDARWMLIVFDVPDRMGGLLARLRFRASKFKRGQWWRIFDPIKPGERQKAAAALAHLRQAGVRSGKWKSLPRQADDVKRAIAAKSSRLERDAGKYRRETQHQAEQLQRRRAVDRARTVLERARDHALQSG